MLGWSSDCPPLAQRLSSVFHEDFSRISENVDKGNHPPSSIQGVLDLSGGRSPISLDPFSEKWVQRILNLPCRFRKFQVQIVSCLSITPADCKVPEMLNQALITKSPNFLESLPGKDLFHKRNPGQGASSFLVGIWFSPGSMLRFRAGTNSLFVACS